jgi:hypothetical protein
MRVGGLLLDRRFPRGRELISTKLPVQHIYTSNHPRDGMVIALRKPERDFRSATLCPSFSGGWIMDTLSALGLAWGLISVVFIALVLYRQNLTRKESDWIPLSNDAKEDSAIQAQTIIEMKTKKLAMPIRAVGALWVVLLLVIIGFWFFHTLYSPPPMPQ